MERKLAKEFEVANGKIPEPAELIAFAKSRQIFVFVLCFFAKVQHITEDRTEKYSSDTGMHLAESTTGTESANLTLFEN